MYICIYSYLYIYIYIYLYSQAAEKSRKCVGWPAASALLMAEASSGRPPWQQRFAGHAIIVSCENWESLPWKMLNHEILGTLFGGFHSHGGTPKWMVYKGEIQLKLII